MTTFPYSTYNNSIPPILIKIQSVGVPNKISKEWFESIGFNKTSEQRIIGVLKFLNFVDKKGVPTEKWRQFKSTRDGKKVLARAIKESYIELFQTYTDAHKVDKTDLMHFFSSKVSAGELALNHTINTFKKALCICRF